jgi:hypothetical protein
MTLLTDPNRRAEIARTDCEQGRGDSRREALKRLGKYGAYTAPLVILSSEAAAQAESPKP